MPKGLTPHPVATLFPDMPAGDFAALVDDIRQHGVKIPILVNGGLILDGRHRYRACLELGKPCPVVEWNGRDPWFEVQSRNLVRRHLAKEQIYAICKLAAERFPELAAPVEAAKAEARERKAQAKGQPRGKKVLIRSQGRLRESADIIGAQVGVSGATVKRVDRLAREAPELVPKVAAGEVSAKKALSEAAIGKRHGQLRARTTAAAPFLDRAIRRLHQQVNAEWVKWPHEYRVRFLEGLQCSLQKLSHKERETGDDQARSMSTELETVWDGARDGPNRGLLGVMAHPVANSRPANAMRQNDQYDGGPASHRGY